MKNPYLKNVNKIEFVITDACTGQCKHCSAGAHIACGARIDPEAAAKAVREIAAVYDIKTVMTFGGEPLLYPDAVYAIQSVATALDIPCRQVITNGYFSNDPARIAAVARELAACGVNDLLLSVDAFHQETIPLSVVRCFAKEALACGIPLRLSPAWLVSPDDENPYNRKTKEILGAFADLKIPVGEGNVVFPEGNAKKYLAAYFGEQAPQNPYVEDPFYLYCLSFAANGDVLNGNLYRQGIGEILQNYQP